MYELITPSGEHHPLPQGVTTLGREDCDVTLHDGQVSRRHAQIRRQGNRLTLQDLGSTNGTFANGSRVTGTYQLQAGDQIYLGTTTLQVRSTPGAAPTQVASPDQLLGGGQPPSFDAPEPPAPWGTPAPSPQPEPYFSAQDPQQDQHAAPGWPQQPPQQVVYVQQPSPPAQPPKQRSTAMLLEIGLGLIGLLGFGWIYAGKTGTGIAILLINLGVNVFFVVLGALTFGLSIIIALPVQITAIIISAVTLNSHTKKRTDLFGP